MWRRIFFKKRKFLWLITGTLVISGVLTKGITMIFNKNNNSKEDIKKLLINKILKAKSQTDTISAMQALYGLENKSIQAVELLSASELKIKYQSAQKLGKLIFQNQKFNKIIFKVGQEEISNLKEILLTITPKSKDRNFIFNKRVWPNSYIDQQNDQIAVLMTFFKNKIIKVTNKLVSNGINNDRIIFFKIKQYDLLNLFYKFKNTDLQAKDFNYYNTFLNDRNNNSNLNIFKNYLLSLRADDSKVQASDLTTAKLTKVSYNTKTGTAIVILSFSYQELSVSKRINDFKY